MIRWKLSRWVASASASTALITSPWLQASQTACGPCSAAIRASCAAHGGHRAGLHPGQALALGEHRGRRVRLHHLPQRLLGQRLELRRRSTRRSRPRPAPARSPARARGPRRAARPSARSAASASRRSPRAARPASRSHHASAPAPGPVSSSSTPGVRPASTPATLAEERPWRSRIRVVTIVRAYGGAASPAITMSTNRARCSAGDARAGHGGEQHTEVGEREVARGPAPRAGRGPGAR